MASVKARTKQGYLESVKQKAKQKEESKDKQSGQAKDKAEEPGVRNQRWSSLEEIDLNSVADDIL